MTTIACDGETMAGDGLVMDHLDTIVALDRAKVLFLKDGRVAGGAGNSFDLEAWRQWIDSGKAGDCPIQSEQFAGLILATDGDILWVDHKGREIGVKAPCAIGSGQDYAIGAMEAGASAERAVEIACRRDPNSGGEITVLPPVPKGFTLVGAA